MRRLNNTLMAVALSAAAVLSTEAQQVEYFWDEDPGLGKGQVLERFTGTSAQVQTELDVSGLSKGIHQIGLRVLNDKYFSATYYRSFFIPAPEEQITRIEYSWDKDVALGTGTAINFTQGSTIDLTEILSTAELKEGLHTLYLRALSSRHHSQTYTRSFYVPATPHSVNAIEYFFDKDPGVGQAIQKVASMTDESLTLAFDVTTDGLSEGVHHIGIRTLTDGTWSETKYRQFLVRRVEDDYVAHLEYFWNNDPGAGKGYVVDITPGKEVTVEFDADLVELAEGTHALGLRAQSQSGNWSTISWIQDIVLDGWDPLQNYLNSLHDTEDVLSDGIYTRQFLNSDWQALYVPFSLSYSDWSDKFDVASLSRFCQYDEDDNGEVDRQELEAVILRSNSETLKANTPYLIRAKKAGTYNFTVNSSNQVAEETNSFTYSASGAKMVITGNYANQSGLKSASRYRLMGGSLFIPTQDDEVLPPYRWYATINSQDKAKVRIKFVDDATGIEMMSVDNEESIGDRRIYDLSGRRINVREGVRFSSLPKGVYIINNKKYIIK